MIDFWISAFACLVFGITSTLHPCPLSATIASISFLSGLPVSRSRHRAYLLFFGISYMAVIAGIGVIFGLGIVSVSRLSLFLQDIFPAFLGPMFIIAGMILTGLLDIGRFKNNVLLNRRRFERSGSLYSVFYIGGMVGLSFCPATAALYFGAMIPLAIQQDHMILFPIIYGFGAILPIILISVALQRFQLWFQERSWTRKIPIIAGWILILSGVYISIQNVF